MKTDWKAGDRALATVSMYQDVDQQVTAGKVYYVEEFLPGIYGDYLVLVGAPHYDIKGVNFGWLSTCFEKVERRSEIKEESK